MGKCRTEGEAVDRYRDFSKVRPVGAAQKDISPYHKVFRSVVALTEKNDTLLER
jgi:hypothetical protein